MFSLVSHLQPILEVSWLHGMGVGQKDSYKPDFELQIVVEI